MSWSRRSRALRRRTSAAAAGCRRGCTTTPDLRAGFAGGWPSGDSGVGQAGLRCVEPRCPVVTWSETSTVIRPRASLTERARVEACRWVGQDGHAVAQVAAAFGVAWGTVMAAVVEYGTPMVDDPARMLGVEALRGGRDSVPIRERAAPHPVRHRDDDVSAAAAARRGARTVGSHSVAVDCRATATLARHESKGLFTDECGVSTTRRVAA